MNENTINNKDRLRAAHAICESLKDYARKYVVCSEDEREIIIDQINSISYTIFPCLDNDTISITADSFSDLKRKIEAKMIPLIFTVAIWRGRSRL